LSYALVDPTARELIYASAGHIFPYRVSADGKAYELEAASYPLGVRADVAPLVRRERLAAGDYVVLLSDGVVEARRQDGDELFGFARVAASLERHAGGSPEALVRGVLGDLESFTGRAPREDDVTLLALRLPA
jgi:sigma-B regulation protein RsbU (phosphoserine phosphatase)